MKFRFPIPSAQSGDCNLQQQEPLRDISDDNASSNYSDTDSDYGDAIDPIVESRDQHDHDHDESNTYHPFTSDGTFNNQLVTNRMSSTTTTHKDYRGFNTSIGDMYRYTDQERIDCCSIACFGCLQSDRNRYIITGKKPPTLYRRCCSHVVIPTIIFGLAIFTAVNVPDPYTNQLLCYGFILAFIFYFMSQCLKGSWKRRQLRRNLLWAKYHKEHSGRFRHRGDTLPEDEEDDDDEEHYLMGQTKGDIFCAHALCGCYATDRPPNFVFDADEKITFCTRIFDCFSNICCRKVCGVHCQCCGFCGVAQEGRQLEALVRPEMLRIDYITMQPMMEYYPAIYEARHCEGRPSNWWFNRLSSFSRWTVINTIIGLVLLFLWSLLSRGLNHSFGPKNYLIFCLTLLQAFILLTIVYWRHTKDISIDALVKFFAAGFFLSTTLGVFYELVLGLIIRFTMSMLMAMSGIDTVEDNGFQMPEPGFGNVWTAVQEVNYGGVNYHAYLEAYGNDHPIVYTIYVFVTSFILAALIEEVCKYFGYRMVDHPDFHTRAEVEAAMRYQEDDGVQQTVDSFAEQDRTCQSQGAAITVAMVAVGIGFACCENLVYVFIYGKATLASEVLILFARSLFPIHPIAAALQSIGVCKRDVENDPKIRLGRIVLPGIVFHGLYDFSVVWITFLGNRHGNYVDGDDRVSWSTEEGAEKLSSIVSTAILFGGICYYFRESRRQRQRLSALDSDVPVMESNLT